MSRQVHQFVLAVAMLGTMVLAGANEARAVAHTTRFSAPLVYPWDHCPGYDGTATSDIEDETSTTNCPGTYAKLSPWAYDQGSVEIDDGTIALRLDNLRVASSCLNINPGRVCHNDRTVACSVNADCSGGSECVNKAKICKGYNGACETNADCSDGNGCGSTACRCHDSIASGDNCFTHTDCGSGVSCGPSNVADGTSATNSNYFKVILWQQAYCAAGTGCPKTDLCKSEVFFDLKYTSLSKNEDVDSTENFTSSCGAGAEIRHLEVYDKYGNIVGVTGR